MNIVINEPSFKVGAIDEADMTLIGNSDLEGYFEFDDKNQQIIVPEWWRWKTLPKGVKHFVKNQVFDCTDYFDTFVDEMQNALGTPSKKNKCKI